MAFDPVTMALCKGEASAGDVGLPYINLTTPIEFGQTVRLSAEESAALYRSIWSIRPPVIVFNLDIAGTLVLPFVMGSNVFIGCIFSKGGCITIEITSTSEYLPDFDGYYWEVTTYGGTLNPIE